MSQASTPTPNAVPWADLARVGGVSLSLFIAFGCLLPIFPLWVEERVGSMANVGLTTTFAAGIGLVLGRPVAARMMEGRRRAPTMIIGALICSLAAALFPWGETLTGILGLRIIQGLGFGMVTTAGIAAITDLAPPERRGQVLGYYGASNALSLILGPALGGIVAREWGANATFFMAAIIGLLPVVSLIGLHEPSKPKVAGKMRLRDALAVARLKPIVFAHFFGVMVHGAILTFIPALFAAHNGWMSTEAFYIIDGLVLVGFRVAVGKRFDAYGRGPFVLVGLAFMALAPMALGLGNSDTFFVLAAVAYGIGFGAYVPSVNALVGDVVPAEYRARGFAVFMLAFDVAMASGGLVFGFAADAIGVSAALALSGVGPAIALAAHLIWRPAVNPVVPQDS